MNERPPTAQKGRLTRRQEKMLDLLIAGHRQKDIHTLIPVSASSVRNESTFIQRKLGSKTLQQATARYERARAYLQAAEMLRKGIIASPQDATEEHVNHVLEGMATVLVDHARRILPK